MNFNRYNSKKWAVVSDLMNYCHNIIKYRETVDERYERLAVSHDSRTVRVYDKHVTGAFYIKTIIELGFDERRGDYFFLEHESYGDRELEKRLLIDGKKDFYVYFDTKIAEYFKTIE